MYQGLRQTAGDRVDAGRADADDRVDKKRGRPGTSRSANSPSGAAAEPELLAEGEEDVRSDRNCSRAAIREDQDRGRAERDQVQDQGVVQPQSEDRRRRE
jgi:hypothetical protein